MNNMLSDLKELTMKLVRGCTRKSDSGITLFTPDGIASYDALWTRDFSYMVEYAPETMSNEEIIHCVDFTINGKRADGWMPDRVYADGLAVYAAGTLNAPAGEANLDNTPFLVFIVSDLLKRVAPEEAKRLFDRWYQDLAQGLRVIPLDADGLVYSNPQHPHSPYGFTDTIGKTGSLFMESLLLWRACAKMADMCSKFGKAEENKLCWLPMKEKIESNIFKLYDENSGAFWAASEDCRQIDIWGNAYMLYIGFPAKRAEATVLRFLHDHADQYIEHGQIRHLLKGEYWNRLLIDVPVETYQNGAYWATATGWLAWCLYQTDKPLGTKVLTDAVNYLLNEGCFECINGSYQKLPSYVVSATNVFGAVVRMIQEDPSLLEVLRA